MNPTFIELFIWVVIWLVGLIVGFAFGWTSRESRYDMDQEAYDRLIESLEIERRSYSEKA